MKTYSAFLTLSLICLTILLAVGASGAPLTARTAGAAVTFIDQDGVPVTGPVRVLCFAEATAAAPFADRLFQAANGQVQELPGNCAYLAALRLRHSQPAGKRDGFAYQIYATSWPPGETQPAPAVGAIILSDQQPLTLFHIVASLAWTPLPDSAVATAADIQTALRELSAVLFDWTEGQMAVGSVRVHVGGQRWAEADLRFLPANDKRPSAFVGGMVAEPLVYSGHLSDALYTPAATYYGRLWDGRDAFVEGDGRWSQPAAYRTIAHEWGHYALFLYDEYQSSSGLSGYCICHDLAVAGCRSDRPDASAMAYHYGPAEFWHINTHLTVNDFCYETWQYHVHGMSDWETLALWHVIQGLPLSFAPLQSPAQLSEGPALGLTTHLFGREPGYNLLLPIVGNGADVSTSVRSEPIIGLFLDAPAPPTVSQPNQIYLLKGGADQPTHILPQGRVVGDPHGARLGEIRLLDVETPGDAVRAYVDWHETGQRYALFSEQDPNGDVWLLYNPWAYRLDHRFTLDENQVRELKLWLLDKDAALEMPVAQLCDMDAAIGCHPDWRLPMERVGEWWQAVFTPLPGQPELPRYLAARIVDGGDPAVSKEIVQWLQVAGGVGPTHNDGMAPLVDDIVMVNTNEPFEDAADCNLVSYTPAADWQARQAPLPPDVGGIIGFPVDIKITLYSSQCPNYLPGQPIALPTSVFINLGYSQDEVDRLGLNEETQLVVLRYGAFGWALWQQVGVNSDLNWLTTVTSDDGVYAVGWTP